MSINMLGCAKRSFINGMRLCPPAKNLASSPYCPTSEIASAADDARL
jgi:hypothetical protein